MVNDAGETDRLRREAADLRSLVRELSGRLSAAVAALPLETALALARGGDASLDPPLRLEHWNETIEMTRADVASEMTLLWRRLPSRENA